MGWAALKLTYNEKYRKPILCAGYGDQRRLLSHVTFSVSSMPLTVNMSRRFMTSKKRNA